MLATDLCIKDDSKYKYNKIIGWNDEPRVVAECEEHFLMVLKSFYKFKIIFRSNKYCNQEKIYQQKHTAMKI